MVVNPRVEVETKHKAYCYTLNLLIYRYDWRTGMNKDLSRLKSNSNNRAINERHGFLTPDKNRFLRSSASAVLGSSDAPESFALKHTSLKILAE